MSIEVLMIVGKYVWMGFTLLLGGIVKHLWSEYKEQKKNNSERIDRLEKDIIRLQETTITHDKLEELLKPIKEQFLRIESKMDNRFENLRDAQQSDFKEIMKAIQGQNK